MFHLKSSKIFRIKDITIAKIVCPFYPRLLNRFYLSINNKGEQNIKESSQIKDQNSKNEKIITTSREELGQLFKQILQKKQQQKAKKRKQQQKIKQRAQQQNTKQREQQQKAKQRQLQQKEKKRKQQQKIKQFKKQIIFGLSTLITTVSVNAMFYSLHMKYYSKDNRVNRANARQQQQQKKNDQKQEFIKNYVQNPNYLKEQDSQTDNKELQEQFYNIINIQEKKQIMKVHVFSGISGIGKTTTLKNIIRQMSKKDQYKGKVYYISLGLKDKSSQVQKESKISKSNDVTSNIAISKNIQLYKNIEDLEIIKSYILQKDYQKEGQQKVQKIIDKNTNITRFIAPTIFIDDLNQLQRIKDQQTIIDFFQSLYALSLKNVRVIAISSSTSFSQKYSKKKQLIGNNGRLCQFELLESIQNETVKRILGAITQRHLQYQQNKNYLQGSKLAFQNKIEQFIKNQSGFLPRQANNALVAAFNKIRRTFSNIKDKQDIYQVLLKQLKDYRSNQIKDKVKMAYCQIKKTQLFKNKKQILKSIFDQICELKADNFSKDKCIQISERLKEQYRRSFQIDAYQIQDIYSQLQAYDITCYCYPRSQSMQDTLKKIREQINQGNQTADYK